MNCNVLSFSVNWIYSLYSVLINPFHVFSLNISVCILDHFFSISNLKRFHQPVHGLLMDSWI